ncbi:MAG TPA: hypothetical protein VG126_17135 [Thermoleophilaceae bacterium]|nr:hypothetical protein [Thermoleophilaceae bacterium]
MKATRAYIAGLGTTGVLIGSFLLLLMVGSAFVAFQGTPGEASSDGLDRLDVSHSGQGAGAARAEQADGTWAGTATDRRDGAPRPGGKRRGKSGGGSAHGADGLEGGRAAGSLSGAPGRADDSGTSTGGSAPAGGGSGGSSGSEAGGQGLPVQLPQRGGTGSAPSVGDVTGDVGGTVEQTTGGLGGTVGAAPPLEEPVTQTGEAMGGVTQQAASGPDGAVSDVTGAVGDVTDSVGGAAGP